MPKLDKLNGQQLYAAISVGIKNLVAHQKTLDEINVFPVPDGDTGTNLVFTLIPILTEYKNHAFVLEKYIDANRQDPRWIFYTAQSYHDSASIPDNKEENEERLRRALKYYKERVNRTDGYAEEIYYSQFRIGTIMRSLEEPWNLTHQELLKAYNMDPTRGESIKIIIDYYLQMRNVESEEMITVTPRQLEGIIRLSTARARLLMKDKVEEEDAERAIFLIQSMLQDAGVDVNTGKVDLGVLQGKPRSEVSKMQLFMDVLKSLEGDNKVPVEERAFVEELEKSEKFSEEEARNYIRRMLREASIYESKPGHYNRV